MEMNDRKSKNQEPIDETRVSLLIKRANHEIDNNV